jgi:hypothetical protein
MDKRTYALMLIAVLAWPCSVRAQQARGVGYPSVAAAMEALKARSDVTIQLRDGWTVVDDRTNMALWSFTPPGHPAHPAVVKRTVVEKDGKVSIAMTGLCQASKDACDTLMAQFNEMQQRANRELREKIAAEDAPPSSIDVRPLSESSFELTLRSYRSRTVQAGEVELAPKAREICGARFPSFEKYEFQMSESLSGNAPPQAFVMKQLITCRDAPPERPSTMTDSAGPWPTTPLHTAIVEGLTFKYLTAKDEGRYEEAFASMSSEQRASTSLEKWSNVAEKFRSAAGALMERKVRKVTWYRNPPKAEPGVYAAVDFTSEFTNVQVCGYVAWRALANGSYVVVREEHGLLPKEAQQKLKPEELAKARAMLGC